MNGHLHLNGDKAFVGNYNCPGNNSSPVLGPVPFASFPNFNNDKANNKPFKIAVFGLNPFLGGRVCAEKAAGRNDLGDYAKFYTSERYIPNVFRSASIPFVLNDPQADNAMSRYYLNIFKILYPLINHCDYQPAPDIFKGCGTPAQKANLYLANLIKAPLIVAELIPFHSIETATIDIGRLYTFNRNCYQTYHQEMFKMLDAKLANNGILFSNGNAASHALCDVLGNNLVIINTINGAQFGVWNGRFVILLFHQLGSKGGVFNGNKQKQMDGLINTIRAGITRLGGSGMI